VFQDFKLVNGTWDVRNEAGELERVRPQDITRTALLTIEGELDDISGSGQTAAAHDLCTGVAKPHRMHFEAPGAGHYGIFSGRRWREMVHPVVKTFILAHQPATTAPAPAPKASPQTVSKAPVRAASKAKPVKTAAVAKAVSAKVKALPKPAAKGRKTVSA
jgi:poly(3-hydroxybutyrate) depolymerase